MARQSGPGRESLWHGRCWPLFLRAHGDGLTACDLFTVEVLTLASLRRYLVFFVIELKTCRVTIAGIHPQPCGTWMEQMARNLTDPGDGFLRTASHLFHDRDPLYTGAVGDTLRSAQWDIPVGRVSRLGG